MRLRQLSDHVFVTKDHGVKSFLAHKAVHQLKADGAALVAKEVYCLDRNIRISGRGVGVKLCYEFAVRVRGNGGSGAVKGDGNFNVGVGDAADGNLILKETSVLGRGKHQLGSRGTDGEGIEQLKAVALSVLAANDDLVSTLFKLLQLDQVAVKCCPIVLVRIEVAAIVQHIFEMIQSLVACKTQHDV